MINKFKDFLKKLSRKKTGDMIDQDDISEQELSDVGPVDETYEESEEQLPESAPVLKKSWKDKFKISLPKFGKKKDVVSSDDFINTLSEDKTGESPLPDLGDEASSPETSFSTTSFSDKPSWKERLSTSVSGIKTKIGSVNIREWKLPEGMKNKGGENLISLSPNISKNLEKFLSRDARETFHQVSLVVLICVLTYTLGKLTALVLKGTPTLDSARDYTVSIDLENDFNPATLGQVRSINIFRTNTGLGSKKKVADTKCEEAQQASNLPIKLVNTIVLQDSVKSLASVQVRGNRDLEEVREGDQISNIAKIFKISRLEIIIKNLESGVCESVASDKARETRSPISVMSPSQSREFKANRKMPGIENEGNKFQISKALLDEKMKDIASILTQARAIKIQNPDGSLAFKMTEMDPAGIFPYLGLQDQDIITSINGKQIYDMNEVMSLFARIKNLDKLQLGIKREGTDSVLDYNIKK